MNLTVDQILLVALCAGVLLVLILLIVLLVRSRSARMDLRLAALQEDNERLARMLREEQRGARQELGAAFGDFRAQIEQRLATGGTQQGERMEHFGLQLRQSLGDLGVRNDQRLTELRTTLETRLKNLQQDNQQQLEKMRATVDEKLQQTLETRIGQSFKTVSERLEAVQRGLGEMRELATGVGDLKRVLTNVKTRGTFGEIQLGKLLGEILVAGQYEANVATVPGSGERVEFAIRLPGAGADSQVWLPIDAKFPREDYDRLMLAREAADADAARMAADALEKRVRVEAAKIRQKYVSPPHTTDFAVLFLPTEGLYAEAINRPGLFEDLQRHEHITLAGPTTLAAIINALQMGFRTLAIEQRSSEVWQLLGAVKTEFGKFGGMLDTAMKQVETVRNTLKKASGKTTTIRRRLKDVESLGEGPAARLLVDEAGLATPASGVDDET